MKEWLTAREIADEQLPYMPVSKRGINMIIESEAWNEHPSFARTRSGRGGGMEYHIHLLPTLAQVAYTQKYMVVDLPREPRVKGRIEASHMTEVAAKERDARLAILGAYSRFTRGLNLGSATYVQVFTDKYNVGSIKVEPWVREIVPTLSKRSLARWKQAKRQGDLGKLGVDRSQARKGTGVLDTANNGRVKAFMLALVAQQPHLSAADVRTLCRSEFGDTITVVSKGVEKALNMPPIRTFQDRLSALKKTHKVELTKLTNPDLYRSTMAPSGVGMLRYITEPNQLWQIDASPTDALCVDGRYSIYACIDIATRRTIWLLSRTPRASAVALLIRKAVQAWGKPKAIKTDNGSDFVAHDTQRLFAYIGIESEVSDAYSPEQKGHVERVIRTFQHMVGPLLPGFIGHNVTDRKAIENRKSFSARLGETEAETFGVSLTAAQLQQHIDDWNERVYQHRPHAGIKNMSPFQMAAASSASIETVDERALDLLLMPVAGNDGRRVTTKFGIRIDHRQYMVSNIMPGTPVFVRQDPLDLGKAYVFAEDGAQFLGTAICPELSGMHPETVVKAMKEMQRDMIADATRDIKADMRRIAKGPALIERVLEVARRDEPNVIPLPKRKEEHSTPQIAAAIEAMGEKINPSRQLNDRESAEHRRLIEQMAAEDEAELLERHQQRVSDYHDRVAEERVAGLPENVTKLPETPKERYVRAVMIRRSWEAGSVRDPYDIHWIGGYELSAEFKAQAKIHADFGDAYLS